MKYGFLILEKNNPCRTISLQDGFCNFLIPPIGWNFLYKDSLKCNFRNIFLTVSYEADSYNFSCSHFSILVWGGPPVSIMQIIEHVLITDWGSSIIQQKLPDNLLLYYPDNRGIILCGRNIL